MTVTERYSDEPRCICLHPKVVHRGEQHISACGAIRYDDDYADRCACVAFRLAVPA